MQSQLPGKGISKKLIIPLSLITAETNRGAIVSSKTAEIIIVSNLHFQTAQIEGAEPNICREQFERYVEVIREFLLDTSDLTRSAHNSHN